MRSNFFIVFKAVRLVTTTVISYYRRRKMLVWRFLKVSGLQTSSPLDIWQTVVFLIHAIWYGAINSISYMGFFGGELQHCFIGFFRLPIFWYCSYGSVALPIIKPCFRGNYNSAINYPACSTAQTPFYSSLKKDILCYKTQPTFFRWY